MPSRTLPLLEYAGPDTARGWNGRAIASLALGAVAMPAAMMIARAVGPSVAGEWITVTLLGAVAALAITQGARALRNDEQRGTNAGYVGVALGAFWFTMAFLHALLRLFGR